MAKPSASTSAAIAMAVLLLASYAVPPVVHGARHVTAAVVRAPAARSNAGRVAAPRGHTALFSTNPGPSNPKGHNKPPLAGDP
ncbi:hypothetical protein PAHAL_5G394500 [Panicum hallii]|uniref:Uncharacterized protein n=1 Tax=Panicum hallii TaxID=206008 RepID=A0A2T8IMN5_9POAL|nr:hypothetical protein PAHAL_5G394500 [Panicum hallii]